MRWYTLLGWACCLWVAAGLEAAWGTGAPGPVFLVAVMAGLWSGMLTGVATGALAGLYECALGGGQITLWVALGLLAGAGASIFSPRFSRRHPLIGIGVSALATAVTCLVLGLAHGTPAADTALFAIRQSGVNSLWIIPIYGIVFVVSLRRANTFPRWE